MRFNVVLLAVALFCASAPVRADDQSRLQAAREVVRLSHASDHLRVLLPLMDKQLRPMLLQQSGNNAKLVDQFMARVEQRFAQNVDSFTDLAAHLYAREFTDDDLNALVTFYKSSAGQHFIAKQVEIASGMLVVGQQWGAKLAQEVLEEFKQQQANPASKL